LRDEPCPADLDGAFRPGRNDLIKADMPGDSPGMPDTHILEGEVHA